MAVPDYRSDLDVFGGGPLTPLQQKVATNRQAFMDKVAPDRRLAMEPAPAGKPRSLLPGTAPNTANPIATPPTTQAPPAAVAPPPAAPKPGDTLAPPSAATAPAGMLMRSFDGTNMFRKAGTNEFGDAKGFGVTPEQVKRLAEAKAPIVRGGATVMTEDAGPTRPGESLVRPMMGGFDQVDMGVSPKTTAFNVSQINKDIRARNAFDAQNGTWSSGGGGLTIQSTGTQIDADTMQPLATNDSQALRENEQKVAELNTLAAKLQANPNDPSVSAEQKAKVIQFAQAKAAQGDALKQANQARLDSVRYQTALQDPTDTRNANLALNPEMRKNSAAERDFNAKAATDAANAQAQRDIATAQAGVPFSAGGVKGAPDAVAGFVEKFAPRNPDGSINAAGLLEMLAKLNLKDPFAGLTETVK